MSISELKKRSMHSCKDGIFKIDVWVGLSTQGLCTIVSFEQVTGSLKVCKHVGFLDVLGKLYECQHQCLYSRRNLVSHCEILLFDYSDSCSNSDRWISMDTNVIWGEA